MEYRFQHIAAFDQEAGRALHAKQEGAWGTWLTAHWAHYRQFCLQYAEHLAPIGSVRRKNATLSDDTKESIRELFDYVEWAAEDAWYPDECQRRPKTASIPAI
jgi:hypothetical protein